MLLSKKIPLATVSANKLVAGAGTIVSRGNL